jgi:flagellar P-ring protein precursor FlgI
MRNVLISLVILAASFGALVPSADAARLEELVDVQGIRPNQLIGYGLVVGLNNTGDRGQARFTVQSTAAMLRRLGATIDPNTIQMLNLTRNAAAVMITATLPANASSGMRVDVVVSSLANARSLAGGTLLQTPLYGADRQVYAVAQGPVLVGGYTAQGASGTTVSVNHTTVGRVPEGGIVERPIRQELSNEALVLQLREPSFITAQRVVEKLNETFGENSAQAVDSANVRLTVPETFRANPVGLVAQLQALDVIPDSPARVVIDERTGTIALGENVRISQVAIAQGGLTVEILEQPAVSQPGAFAGPGGVTTTVDQSQVNATLEPGQLRFIDNTASLRDVVAALNALGVRPRDLAPIFQALRTAGALRARIEVQ